MKNMRARSVLLADVADIERAATKIYPQGTVYIHLSAANGIVYILDKDSELTGRSAVVTPKDPRVQSRYLFIALERSIEDFWRLYEKTAINLTPDNLKEMRIIWHDDLEAQSAMCNFFSELDNAIKYELQQIEFCKQAKTYLLARMFV